MQKSFSNKIQKNEIKFEYHFMAKAKKEDKEKEIE
ncbi:MAG: hypothetical protein RLZZ546_813 [Bacteroidota bacterium]|jgi:hypothetical protein